MKSKIYLFFLSISVLLVSVYAYAQSISSVELIANAKRYNNKTVVFQGEAIGEVMERDNGAWLNLNDGPNGIGIWVPLALAKQVNHSGNYKHVGDTVEVVGVFHNACAEHGGDLDIHAQSLRVVFPGRVIDLPVNIGKRNFAIFLLGVLTLIWILTILKKK